MKALPYLVFIACAAIAGCAAVALVVPAALGHRLLPDYAAFLLVFFGLAAVVLPVLIASQGGRNYSPQ